MHLYVPPACVEAVKRICDEYQIIVSELWTYTTSFDQVRFTLVSRSPDAPTVKVPVAAPKPAAKPKPVAKPMPVATLRQAQGRPDLSTGSRSPRAQSRGEQSRGTKPKPVAKPKPAVKA